MWIPLNFTDFYMAMYAQDKDQPPLLVDIHGHCWNCEQPVWAQQQPKARKKRETVLFHCHDCDVRFRGVSCRCRAKKREVVAA